MARKLRRRHKLTHGDVREIRRLVANGETQVSVAQRFDVHQSHISGIVHRHRRIVS